MFVLYCEYKLTECLTECKWIQWLLKEELKAVNYDLDFISELLYKLMRHAVYHVMPFRHMHKIVEVGTENLHGVTIDVGCMLSAYLKNVCEEMERQIQSKA